MRRLNGRMEILVYVGRSPRSKRGWKRVREIYAAALHYTPGSHRVWAIAEELIAIDRARSLTVADVVVQANGGHLGGPVGDHALGTWLAMFRTAGASPDMFPKRRG